MTLLERQWCHLELLLRRVLLNNGLDGVIVSEDEHQYPPLQKGTTTNRQAGTSALQSQISARLILY